MIEVRGLSRQFGSRPAIESLSFEVPEGRLCALLGPNGAGKTTTVRVLLGLLPPSSGQAVVAGINLPAGDREGARLRAVAGLLTETPGFYDRLSGWENLQLFGQLYGLSGLRLRERIEHWLRKLGLWDARLQPFGTFSKGMKQRLALIRAVLHEPKVLFLDEPTSGLDPAVAREVRDLIAAFRAEGRTILLCTHNLAEAQALADLVGILRQRMLAFGTLAELTGGKRGLSLQLRGEALPIAEALGRMPGVRDSSARGPLLTLDLDDLARDTPQVVREVVRLGGEILEVRPVEPSLEEVYLRAVQEPVE